MNEWMNECLSRNHRNGKRIGAKFRNFFFQVLPLVAHLNLIQFQHSEPMENPVLNMNTHFSLICVFVHFFSLNSGVIKNYYYYLIHIVHTIIVHRTYAIPNPSPDTVSFILWSSHFIYLQFKHFKIKCWPDSAVCAHVPQRTNSRYIRKKSKKKKQRTSDPVIWRLIVLNHISAWNRNDMVCCWRIPVFGVRCMRMWLCVWFGVHCSVGSKRFVCTVGAHCIVHTVSVQCPWIGIFFSSFIHHLCLFPGKISL